jgi:hypothetical protein
MANNIEILRIKTVDAANAVNKALTTKVTGLTNDVSALNDALSTEKMEVRPFSLHLAVCAVQRVSVTSPIFCSGAQSCLTSSGCVAAHLRGREPQHEAPQPVRESSGRAGPRVAAARCRAAAAAHGGGGHPAECLHEPAAGEAAAGRRAVFAAAGAVCLSISPISNPLRPRPRPRSRSLTGLRCTSASATRRYDEASVRHQENTALSEVRASGTRPALSATPSATLSAAWLARSTSSDWLRTRAGGGPRCRPLAGRHARPGPAPGRRAQQDAGGPGELAGVAVGAETEGEYVPGRGGGEDCPAGRAAECEDWLNRLLLAVHARCFRWPTFSLSPWMATSDARVALPAASPEAPPDPGNRTRARGKMT